MIRILRTGVLVSIFLNASPVSGQIQGLEPGRSLGLAPDFVAEKVADIVATSSGIILTTIDEELGR